MERASSSRLDRRALRYSPSSTRMRSKARASSPISPPERMPVGGLAKSPLAIALAWAASSPRGRLTTLARTEPSTVAIRQTTTSPRRPIVLATGVSPTTRVRSASRVPLARRWSSWLSIQMPAVTVPSRQRRDPAGEQPRGRRSALWRWSIGQLRTRCLGARSMPSGARRTPGRNPGLVWPARPRTRWSGAVTARSRSVAPWRRSTARTRGASPADMAASRAGSRARPATASWARSARAVRATMAERRASSSSEAYRVRPWSPQSANNGCERPAPGSSWIGRFFADGGIAPCLLTGNPRSGSPAPSANASSTHPTPSAGCTSSSSRRPRARPPTPNPNPNPPGQRPPSDRGRPWLAETSRPSPPPQPSPRSRRPRPQLPRRLHHHRHRLPRRSLLRLRRQPRRPRPRRPRVGS
jgi:hypothetical protein